MKKRTSNGLKRIKATVGLFLKAIVIAGIIFACFYENFGIDLYKNGFVIYDENAFIKFISIDLLVAFLSATILCKIKEKPQEFLHLQPKLYRGGQKLSL